MALEAFGGLVLEAWSWRPGLGGFGLGGPGLANAQSRALVARLFTLGAQVRVRWLMSRRPGGLGGQRREPWRLLERPVLEAGLFFRWGRGGHPDDGHGTGSNGDADALVLIRLVFVLIFL